jgi:hypothetical protein
MPPLVALAALLASAQVPAGAVSARQSTEPPMALVEEAQVRELCSALARRGAGPEADDPAEAAAALKEREAVAEKAVSRTYQVEIPSRGFTLGRYRPAQSELELDGSFPVRAIGDRLALDLDGIDDVAFSASPEQVATLLKEKKANELRLSVVFRVSGEPCAGNANARSWRLAGAPIAWQILDGRGVVAAANEEGLPIVPKGTDGRAAGPSHRFSVKVEKLSLDEAADEGTAQFEGVQVPLDKCAAGAQRAGSLVVVFSVAGRHVRDPQVIVDGVRDEGTSQCVAHALSGAALSGARDGSARGTATLALE